MEIGFGLIFLAGLASFLSPCVLALVPVYIGLLGGEVNLTAQSDRIQFNLLIRTLIFAAGFSLVFVLLGMTSTLIGSWLFQVKDWIARIGGLIIIIFGIHTTGLITIPFLEQEKLLQINQPRQNNYLAAFLMGIAFSAGWSPCIGPILGSVLTAIMVKNSSIGQGAFALAIYSAGMALPFLLISLGMGNVINWVRRNSKLIHGFQIGFGILLVIMGVLLLFGITARLNQLGYWIRI